MPADLRLLPRLAGRMEHLRSLAHTRGIETAYPHHAGGRTAEEQLALFKQGRHQNDAGLWVPDDPVTRVGIVTNARPESAPHCIRIDLDGSVGSAACDLAIVVGEKIAWKKGDPGYDLYPLLGSIGEQVGLTWGGRFHSLGDLDHFELPDWRELALAEET